jgi:hypothetical protein
VKNLKKISEEITRKINEKSEEINKNIPSDEKLYPIYDGIINDELYSKSDFKICWVLKEAYDKDKNGNTGNGGWDILDSNKISDGVKNILTWQRMIYVTYSVLNNFISFDDMDDINNNPEMIQILRNIAYINVNKMPAETTSKDPLLRENYEIWKDILLEQIKDYDADIYIFGATYKFFKNDLPLKDEDWDKSDSDFHIAKKDNKLYINAYHPGIFRSQMSDENYIQGLIEIIKNNIK